MSENILDYPIELPHADISPYAAGNTGVPYVTTYDSGEPGLHVLIMAVTHGNELCGAIALDHLFKNNVQPIKGKLTLAFSNIAAYESFDPENPLASRFVEEDMNRTWGLDVLDGDRDTIETRRARELRPIVDQADVLLDLHSMQTMATPLMICGALEKGQEFARAIGTPEYIVSDAGHKEGTRMRDYGGFGDPASSKNALLLEAGQHWEKAAGGIAIDCTLRFLKHHGTIPADFLMEDQLPLPGMQKMIKVTHPITIQSDDFRFAQPYLGFECIEKEGTILGWDGDQEVLTPYDNCYLIMPSRRLKAGKTAVRLGRLID